MQRGEEACPLGVVIEASAAVPPIQVVYTTAVVAEEGEGGRQRSTRSFGEGQRIVREGRMVRQFGPFAASR